MTLFLFGIHVHLQTESACSIRCDVLCWNAGLSIEEPGFECPSLPFQSSGIFTLSTAPQFITPYEYLAVDGGGNVHRYLFTDSTTCSHAVVSVPAHRPAARPADPAAPPGGRVLLAARPRSHVSRAPHHMLRDGVHLHRVAARHYPRVGVWHPGSTRRHLCHCAVGGVRERAVQTLRRRPGDGRRLMVCVRLLPGRAASCHFPYIRIYAIVVNAERQYLYF